MRIIGNDPSVPRQTQEVASGTLPNGKPVFVNADGTVGVPFNATTIFSEEASTQIAIATSNSGTFVIMHTGPGGGYALRVRAGTISGNTVTLGTSVHVDGIESNLNAQGASVVYDPDNDKFVLFYPNGSNSYYLTSRVATVSGTSISLGTAVVVDSRNVLRVSADYDTSANKVVVAWRGLSGSNVAAAAVGTVSGTNISFGSTATLANRTVNTSINTVYDANANKTAVFYQDSATGHGYYVVGTVSGTSISGGSTAAFYAAATGGGIVAAYDPDLYKIVVLYVDNADSSKGKAIVGTISGTSMSFGSATQYSTTSGYDPGIAYDTANNKFFIFYDKNYGMAGRIGTVSGTSISVGSENVISSNNITDTGVVYDASAGKALLVYRDSANSSYGTLQALDSSFALTNFTSESYIGIARSGAPSGAGVAIDTQGAIADIPVTNFSIASASYDSVSFSVASQDTNPRDLTFNADGTKMFVVSGNTSAAYQYSLSTAFDLSTASYDNVSFSVNSQDGSPYGIHFNTNGTKMFMVGDSNNTVYQYTLSSGFNLSTASYSNVSFSVASQDTNPYGLSFNNDGTKMYIAGGNNDRIYQYSLSTGFDLSTASYDSVSLHVTSQDTVPVGLAFNSNGTKMYLLGMTNDTVFQYSLSTGFDLSTASYDSVSFSVASQDDLPVNIRFNNDGTKMYIIGAIGDKVYQYSTSLSLTPAQSYFVQTDGTLGTTAASPSVFAGTAVSATKLIVKG